MFNKIILYIIIAGFINQNPKETDWSKYLAKQFGGTAEYKLPDNSRVDILTETTAWEVEWSYKWPESIGQAIYYANSTDKEPGVVLLMSGPNAEEDYLEFMSVVAYLRRAGPFRVYVVKNTESLPDE